MADLMQLVTQALSGETLESVSRQIGADSHSTAKAISAALPVLLGALDRNTNQAGGADALLNAIGNNHDGSILDDLAGFLGGGQFDDGNAILGHVLGGNREPVENGISRASGLDLGSVARLLPLLAPIVLGAIGRMQRQQGFDAQGLSTALSQEQHRMMQGHPDAMSSLESLLDGNHDGQVTDDVVKIGSSLFESFFKG